MKVLYGVDNPLFSKKKNFFTLAPSVITWTLKFFRTMYRISKMDTPFEEYLDTISSNQSLKDIIGQHFFRKTPVFFALSYFALYGDYIYPKGGVGAFVKALVDAIHQRGGELRCDTEIIAVDLPPEFFGSVASGHVFYTPDRKGLGNIHTEELRDVLRRWASVSRDEVYAWLRRFCRYNTFEISIPALRDPDAAPGGKTGLIISTLFDYGLTEKVRADGWYEEFKQRIEDEFIEVISSSLYPGLKDKILFSLSASPLSIFDRVGSSEGSIVGWSFEEDIPVTTSMFRMADSVKTALPEVYAAGKWVYSPAGGPTAIMTGRMAARRCLSM